MKRFFKTLFYVVVSVLVVLYVTNRGVPGASDISSLWPVQRSEPVDFPERPSSRDGATEVQRLRQERDFYRDQVDAQQAYIAQTTSLMNSILDDVARVAERHGAAQNLIQQTRSDLGTTPRTRNVEREIRGHVRFMSERMQQNERRLRDLRRRVDQADQEALDLRQTVQTLSETIRAQDQTLQMLQADYRDLQIRLQEVEGENEVLEKEIAGVEEENKTLKEAYYIATPIEQLEELGIVRNGAFNKPRVERLDKNRFTRIDTETQQIRLSNSSKEKILSDHRYRPDLYTMDGRTLTIHKPQEFWAISRYLIIELH